MNTRHRRNGHRSLRTITVAELIKRLENEEPEALVLFACDYGDYHHTEQALGVRGDIEDAKIVESAYSHSGFAIVAEEDHDDDGEPIEETYVVIR